jgi:hypothetical protein
MMVDGRSLSRCSVAFVRYVRRTKRQCRWMSKEGMQQAVYRDSEQHKV